MMNAEKNKQIAALVFSWAFVGACMITIFCFSASPASVSSQTSGGVIRKILELFGVEFSQTVVRKTAHALEYCGLCIAFNIAYKVSFAEFCPLLSFVSTVFYAATDEIHQFFVEGRACQLRDVFVDSCGAAAAVIVAAVVYFTVNHYHKNKSEEEICQQ